MLEINLSDSRMKDWLLVLRTTPKRPSISRIMFYLNTLSNF